MKKSLQLNRSMQQDFFEYAKEFLFLQEEHTPNCINYLNQEILERCFEFFCSRNLTASLDGQLWWYRNGGKKETICFGYSGTSAGMIDDQDDMIENLFYGVFCKAEWVVRGKANGIKRHVAACINYFGKYNYDYIMEGFYERR